MDILSMIRTVGALGVVLGMLAGALWVVRRYDIKLPGRVSGSARKRVELVERLSVDAKRSVALIRRDGCEHLILIGPEGHVTLETGITAPAPAAAPAPAEPATVADFQKDLAAFAGNFGKLVDLSRGKIAAIRGANDDETASDDEALIADTSEETPHFEAPTNVIELSPAASRKRTRRPRDTKRWNRAAVREALNA
jgi:flagellar biogenesis protein FliO